MKKTDPIPAKGKNNRPGKGRDGSRRAAPAGKPAAGAVSPSGSGRNGLFFLLITLFIALAFSLLSMLQFIQNQKWLILILCLLSAVLLAVSLFGKRKGEALSAFLPIFAGYLLWMGLSLLWAVSGKFFLREFSKQLFTLPLVLFVLLYLPRREDAVRKLLFILSAIGAVFAICSIDLASLRLSSGFFSLIPGFAYGDTGFESGTRLTGIFSNANISAGTLGLCLFISIYLLSVGKTPLERISSAVFASFQATTFLLNFSLGATGFFLVSVVVYLICAGKGRMEALLHMLAVALPSLAAVFLSFSAFEAEGARLALPLICAFLAAAASSALELVLLPRLSKALENRARLAGIFLISVVLLALLYAVGGFLLGGSARLSAGQTLRRSAYPEAGDYLLRYEGQGSFQLTVESQDDQEVIMHTSQILYSGPGAGASFTVPEGSRVVYLTFAASEDTLLQEVLLDGPKDYALHLDYPLLPGFIANRLQGLRANENAIQRAAFFRDGMKIFRDHPILGAGLGSFESLIYNYQDFYYETKFVHNHYIQVLLDCGIVGFLLYLAILLLTLVRLLRVSRAEHPFRALYPALCAAFSMLLLHSVMEVVLSTPIYLLYAYCLLALIDLCYGRRLKSPLPGQAGKAVTGVLSLVYAVLIALNMFAASSVSAAAGSSLRLFSALEKAHKIDVFERNDWMVSYIFNCAQLDSAAYYPRAEEYASQLLDVPSNSLHQYLVRFYLHFREYDNALTAARKGTGFNYSDSSTWNTMFEAFAAAYEARPEDGPQILDAVRVLNDDLQATQERLMDSIILGDTAKLMIASAMN
ncbi:MAG: O-antigen ligase family protein [Oscillospiraceae bacterium]|nr:O-antigen ligase family protein [Oscillospiraceae bacterium]